jgi:hypothetical protein
MTSWEKVSPHYRCGIWRAGAVVDVPARPPAP